MIIANPLYDTAFKGLINDLDVAKALLGVLLQKEVLMVDPRVTEYLKPLKDDDLRPRYLRVDYVAIIRDERGEEQKILVEVQKAAGAEDILRFREYLAVAGYMPKQKEESPLPIVTIYFLGFTLENIATPCLKVERQYVDMLEDKVLEAKEKFVELLTHDSIIIQTPRINTGEQPKTELEKLLSIFEQKNFMDMAEATINYKYPVDDGYMRKMVDILHYIGTDPDERAKLDNEAYWNRHEENTTGRMLKAEEKVAKQSEELAEQSRVLAERDRELAALRQKNRDTAKLLKKLGVPTAQITEATGMTDAEIDAVST